MRNGGIIALSKRSVEKIVSVLVLLGIGFVAGLALSPTKERIIVLVATHDGKFHADEVFAIAIIKKIYDPVLILRTREPGLLKGATMRVDVGGKYSPALGDFDHHQPGSPTREENGIPFSACGLVWNQFGGQFVKACKAGLRSSEVFHRIERTLITSIDAIDNGIRTYDTIAPFKVYDINWYVNSFIPRFPANYMPSRDNDSVNYLMHSQFVKAVEWAGEVLELEVNGALRWLEDKDYLGNVVREQKNRDIISLTKAIPWVEAIVMNTDAVYVTFPDDLSKNWVLQTVPVSLSDKFSSRKLLPKHWAGLRDKDLQDTCGVADAVFCHKDRFIAISRSYDGIKQMAELALDY
jgi:uncharacterized UPF0160 family protein